MSEIASIRRRNLRRRSPDGPDDLGALIKLLQARVGNRYTYWRDLLKDEKNSFGERAARKIEEKMGWPGGCLDIDERRPPHETHATEAPTNAADTRDRDILQAQIVDVLSQVALLSDAQWHAVRGVMEGVVGNPGGADDAARTIVQLLAQPRGKRPDAA